MSKRVSVVVPSRLATNPVSQDRNLFLDLCLGGILRQMADVELEIIVGLDAGQLSKVPGRFLEVGKVPLLFVESDGTGQAKAVNAAARAATGDVIAFCEDDDLWEPAKLEYQLPLLADFDLVTCNQRERDTIGAFVRYNDFATPSGWVMKRELFRTLAWAPGALSGGFDETFRFHVDTEWLGRANEAGLRRAHLIHDGHTGGSWLANVAKRSKVFKTDGFSQPLVNRLVNVDGGMGTIRRDPDARAVSAREHEIMMQRFGGEVPW